MATFVDITGAEYPSSYKGHAVLPMEGKSLLPVFQGKRRPGHQALYWQISPGKNHAVRQGDWKLVTISDNDPWELYNLKTDRVERQDLSKKYPEKVEELEKRYKIWANRVGITDKLKK
jgi:arylsulfatase